MTVTNRMVAVATATFMALVAGIFAGSADAQVNTSRQVALTPALVERLIESAPEVRATAEGLSAKYGMEGKRTGKGPLGMWQAWSAQTAAHAELNIATQRFGFPDFQTWVMTFSSVATAHAFARSGGGVDAMMAKAMEQVRNNPKLSAAQKAAMMKQFEASSASLDAMRPPQQNLDAVAPYTEQLDRMFRER